MAVQTSTNLEAPATLGSAIEDREHLKKSRSFYGRAWASFRRDKVAIVALVISVILILFSFGAPIVARLTGHDYATGDLRAQLLPPFQSSDHILGTDANGRDILTRLAYGGRVSMMVAMLSLVFTFVIGGTVGSVAGFFGGFIDNILMRFVDVVISVPGITLLLLVSVWWRPGPVGLAVVIASISWTGISRLIRGEVLALRHREFVEAARLVGASDARIIISHIFPNVLSIIIVWASLALPGLIITEATLSYLGFGVRIPIPSWGNMLNEAYQFYTQSWTYAFLPGFFIFLTSLCFNLVGNGLRDALDPRLNK
jgi:ABC-type dipeptide/oligopeptide/nickel transport system permease subunit